MASQSVCCKERPQQWLWGLFLSHPVTCLSLLLSVDNPACSQLLTYLPQQFDVLLTYLAAAMPLALFPGPAWQSFSWWITVPLQTPGTWPPGCHGVLGALDVLHSTKPPALVEPRQSPSPLLPDNPDLSPLLGLCPCPQLTN